MRARSRDLAQNNDHAKRFFSMIESNVIGAKGILLQNKAKLSEGQLDTVNNDKVEVAFKRWGKKNNASVTTRLSWTDIQKIFIKTVARDGEVLVRKVKGYSNEFRFALEFIEADHLDENHNEELTNGHRIVMGVEIDQWKKPVAYHLLTKHPGEYSYYRTDGKTIDRVPADQIIHAFIQERPTQTRGIPWMHSAMTRLNMLGGYEEAELVAARTAACKMGFFTSPSGDGYTGDDKTDDGDVISKAEPGMFEQLPQGMDFKSFEPSHPTNVFQYFNKAILRGIASGLNVSYNSLASDLEGVNYSSIRAGLLDERDCWRAIQGWIIENLHEEVYPEWFNMAVVTKQLDIKPIDIERLAVAQWQPRGWAWVDPENDTTAAIMAVNNGLKTRRMIAAEQGYDLEDIYRELAEEKELAKKYGLEFPEEQSTVKKNKKEETSNV
jgi:lambda family phage portal protein